MKGGDIWIALYTLQDVPEVRAPAKLDPPEFALTSVEDDAVSPDHNLNSGERRLTTDTPSYAGIRNPKSGRALLSGSWARQTRSGAWPRSHKSVSAHKRLRTSLALHNALGARLQRSATFVRQIPSCVRLFSNFLKHICGCAFDLFGLF